MQHNHFCVRCSICDTVIRQCRCIEGGRNVTFEPCAKCAQHPVVKAELEGRTLPAKPESEPPPPVEIDSYDASRPIFVGNGIVKPRNQPPGIL